MPDIIRQQLQMIKYRLLRYDGFGFIPAIRMNQLLKDRSQTVRKNGGNFFRTCIRKMHKIIKIF
jgi:hypothetical protein